MIFIANVLTMNGGTTFLIRVCREYQRRGISVAVLLLFPLYDCTLRTELTRYAKIFDLRDFLPYGYKFFRAQLMTFAPVRWSMLLAELRSYGNTVHVMGVFGLLFAFRAARRWDALRITAGVYHQNEYLFSAKSNFFIRTLRRCFSSLYDGQVLFFNELNIKNYSKFFDRDFSSCVVAPIGIDIPESGAELRWEPVAGRLVSVGNLVNFKTYNLHIIGVVAELASKYPTLQYEIYGAGPEEGQLRELARRLGVQDRVHFNGAIPYSEFTDKVRHAALFIGSGTALIEAAAIGVPAMVGIESISQPETYGFLSDIKGLSYNEFRREIPRVGMRDLVDQLLSNENLATRVSEACKQRAREFSVAATVDGFDAMAARSRGSSITLNSLQTVLLFISFATIAMCDRLGLSSTFRNRRDQSF